MPQGLENAASIQFNGVSILYISNKSIPLSAFLMLLERWGARDIELFANQESYLEK